MNDKLKEITETYIKAIDEKDLEGVLALSADNFTLTDPDNFIDGKVAWGEFLEVLFNNEITFKGIDVMADEDTSLLHFDLKVNKMHLRGVDVIKWENNKMISLNAYLYEIKIQNQSPKNLTLPF